MKEKKSSKNPAAMKDHWQMDVSDSVFPKANANHSGDAFLAKRPTEWPTPHRKVNECDY